jgi:hypothetical protein
MRVIGMGPICTCPQDIDIIIRLIGSLPFFSLGG